MYLVGAYMTVVVPEQSGLQVGECFGQYWQVKECQTFFRPLHLTPNPCPDINLSPVWMVGKLVPTLQKQ